MQYTFVTYLGWWYMGAILGRQSYDCGRSRVLVYGSLVQELLNDSIDANMIIIESKINFLQYFSRKVFTSFMR